MNTFEILSAQLKAVSSSNRLQILSYLISGEKCVCKIFEHLDLPQNLVSHHLAVLRKNNLIIARKDGKWVYYSINQQTFSEVKLFFEKFLSAPKKNPNKC